jgi:hypothetical protein
MLLDHDCVDRLGVPESQETKATRATSGTVTHHRTFLDFTELREVVTKRFCIRMPVRLELAVTDDKYDGVSSSLNQVCPVYEYVRSVVSQFNPPMNIFLTKPILAFLPEAHKVSNNKQSRRARAQAHERERRGRCVCQRHGQCGCVWVLWLRSWVALSCYSQVQLVLNCLKMCSGNLKKRGSRSLGLELAALTSLSCPQRSHRKNAAIGKAHEASCGASQPDDRFAHLVYMSSGSVAIVRSIS